MQEIRAFAPPYKPNYARAHLKGCAGVAQP
jgi:hypothetical protein